MIKLIIGNKGSGKTKKLVEAVNATTEASHGNVVCIEKGDTLNFSVTHKARLINTDVYGISGYDAFYGLLCGVCAGNYDVTDVFVDSTFKICEEGVAGLADFVEKLDALSKEAEANITMLISAAETELPEGLKAECVEI